MPELPPRERYRAIMHFEPGVRTLDWEFAYWAAAVERWYGERLQRSSFALVPGLPAGSMVTAEALPSPTPPFCGFAMWIFIAAWASTKARSACPSTTGSARQCTKWSSKKMKLLCS
jgi:hypothetical protein